MKQQPIQKTAIAVATKRASVVMGQGLVTPAVREHLSKASARTNAPSKPKSVVMGQGLVTPAVREHLAKAAKSQSSFRR